MSGPFVLVPIKITDGMLTSSSIAEPASGEAVWNAATSYTPGQEAILLATHYVYEALAGGVDAVSPDVSPKWIARRPTQRWAVLDDSITTQSQSVNPQIYVIRPGICNAFAVYGAEGLSINVSGRTAPGGAVFINQSTDLIEPPIDHYDYYFGRIKALTKLLIKNIIPYADPEFTITITAGSGVVVKAGMFVFGDLRSAVAVDGTGGTQFNPQVKPTSASLIVADGFGGAKITRRTKGTDMKLTAFLPQADADQALAMLQDVLDVPAAWIGSDVNGYAGLNVFGLAEGDVTYAGPGHALFNLSVKGLY